MQMKNIFLLFLFPLLLHSITTRTKILQNETKKIVIQGFEGAYNPSILPIPEGFLLSFRCVPDFLLDPAASYVGVVELDHNFQTINKPHLIHLRCENHPIVSQAEDARLFAYQNKIYMIYNDNDKVYCPEPHQRRDMFIAQIVKEEGIYKATNIVKLIAKDCYSTEMWQKNWIPFVSKDQLFVSYTLNPHQVLHVDLTSGECVSCVATDLDIRWKYGKIRGGAVPCSINDEEYFSFFHSSCPVVSNVSSGKLLLHYFVGAYTFRKEPPFTITKISTCPIVGENFYSEDAQEKHVVFPAGCVVDNGWVYVTYGKDDAEMWVTKFSLEDLIDSLDVLDHNQASIMDIWDWSAAK